MAFVIAVNGAVAALAAFTIHGCTAMAAKQLGGQEVAFLGLGSGWGLFVFGQPFLYSVKKVLGYNAGYAVRNGDVLERILTNITAVGKHMLNGSPGYWAALCIG